MKLSPGLAFMLEGTAGGHLVREFADDDQWTFVKGEYAGLLSHPSLGTMILSLNSSLYEIATHGGLR